ncbi:MAG: hypothetical protein WAU88_05090 [Candidatus Zixiibacteriota bacterium]
MNRRSILLAFLVTFGLVGSVSAGHITLKKNFWGGWRYSTDSVTFQGAGATGDNVKALVGDDSVAVRELSSYASSMGLSYATGIPGGLLLGWPLGGALAGHKWDDTYTIMAAIGAPLVILSTVFETSADKHMKKAVASYNQRQDAASSAPSATIFPILLDGKTLGAGVTIRF